MQILQFKKGWLVFRNAVMSKSVPESSLRLSWVYGYRGHQCRSNCHFNEEGNVVYFVAATGIVYNRESHRQAFYLHHNDDILCLS